MHAGGKLLRFVVPALIIGSGFFVFIRLVITTPLPLATAQGVSAETLPDFGPGEVKYLKPVTTSDHILGNPAAKVKIVEFSDFECPACKQFQPIMHQIISKFGASGDVAWVYRHFPVDAIHSKARKEAAASECANELGGTVKFWSFADKIFAVTPSNDNLDLAELPQIASQIGLDTAAFSTCLESGKYDDHIAKDLADAVNSGASGTPYTIVVAPNGQKFALSGAQSYYVMLSVVQKALSINPNDPPSNQ